MRCAIYARYSSEMQSPTSIDDQIDQCKTAIAEKSWMLLEDHIYKDEAISGFDINRDGYKSLKEAAHEFAFDYIVVDDLSRFGRNTAESIMAYQELTSIGINILSISDHLDTSNDSAKMPYYFKSFMNELFLDDMKKKVKRGLAGQVKRNFSAGGRIFGYRNIEVLDPNGEKDSFGRVKREGVRIEIDPDQAEIIRKIFEMKAKGHGYRVIAQHLNDQSIPSPRHNKNGNSWCTGSVRTIVMNPKYNGDWTYNKTKYIKTTSKNGKPIRKQIKRPQSEWIEHHNEDLKIISDDLWQAVRNKDRKSKKSSKSHNHTTAPGQGGKKYVFAGLLKCGCCGGTMLTSTFNGYSRLVCSNHWNRGNAVCSNSVRIDRLKVEKSILKQIEKKILTSRIVEKLTVRTEKMIEKNSNQSQTQSKELNKSSKALNDEIENLTQFIIKGDTSDRIRTLLHQKESEYKGIETKLQRLGKQSNKVDTEVLKRFIQVLSNYSVAVSLCFHLKYLPDNFSLIRINLNSNTLTFYSSETILLAIGIENFNVPITKYTPTSTEIAFHLTS